METHGRWPWVAAGLIGPTWALVAARRDELEANGLWVAALALPILLSHQTEEWVWPGGFLPFCNQDLLASGDDTWPLSERDGFHVNVTLGWSTAIAGVLLWRRTPSVAAGVLGMEAANATMHTAVAIRGRRYNPGSITGALLMATHAAAGGRVVVTLETAHTKGWDHRRHRRRPTRRPAAGDEDADAPSLALRPAERSGSSALGLSTRT